MLSVVDTACLWADIARWLGNATPDALAGNVTKPFQKETPEINTSTISQKNQYLQYQYQSSNYT